MSPTPRLGIGIPNRWVDRLPTRPELLTFFRRAEELGFDSLWCADRIFHPRVAVPSPLLMLTFAAAATETIRLGTSVFLLSLRHPVEVAKQASTLDMLSDGRLTLAVGLGGRDNEYEAVNQPKGQRRGREEEGIAVLRKLWNEDDVTFHGRYYHMDGATILPRSTQPEGIPLWIGAFVEAGLRRAGTIGDGWLNGPGSAPEQFAESWRIVQDAAHVAGRDPAKLGNAKLLYVDIDNDRERARQTVHHNLHAWYGPNYDADGASAYGSPEEIAEVVRAYGDAGCQTVALGLMFPDVEKLERLAAEVAPAVGAILAAK